MFLVHLISLAFNLASVAWEKKNVNLGRIEKACLRGVC